MATNNALNNKSQELTTDPGASGDSFVQFDINATGEFRVGIDDDDGDSFKISQGSALGTNDTFVMTEDGERTMPLQTAFLAHVASDATNITSNYKLGTKVTFTKIFDIGTNFNINGTFTAPIDGRYLFYCSCKLGDITGSVTQGRMFIITSNRGYLGATIDSSMKTASDEINLHLSALADMDSGDTCSVTIEVGGGGGIVDQLGQATDPITYFCGALIV